MFESPCWKKDEAKLWMKAEMKFFSWKMAEINYLRNIFVLSMLYQSVTQDTQVARENIVRQVCGDRIACIIFREELSFLKFKIKLRVFWKSDKVIDFLRIKRYTITMGVCLL